MNVYWKDAIPYDEKFTIKNNNVEFLIYGYGSDGMVSASKDILKISGENSFYCAEFVKYLLEQSFNKKILPEIVKPMDFLELDNLELVYEGVFRDYINNNEGYQSNVIG